MTSEIALEQLGTKLKPSEDFEDLLPRSTPQDFKSKNFSTVPEDTEDDDELDPLASLPKETRWPYKGTSDTKRPKSTPTVAEPYSTDVDYEQLMIMKENSRQDIKPLISDFFVKLGDPSFEKTRLSEALQLLDHLRQQQIEPDKLIELVACMSCAFPIYTDLANSASSLPKFLQLLAELAKHNDLTPLHRTQVYAASLS